MAYNATYWGMITLSTGRVQQVITWIRIAFVVAASGVTCPILNG
jgi:hypothetical protein